MSEASNAGLPAFVPGLELAREMASRGPGQSSARHSRGCRTAPHSSGRARTCSASIRRCRWTTTGGRGCCSSSRTTRSRAPPGGDLGRVLSEQLPATIRGFPVHFGPAGPADGGTRVMSPLPPGATARPSGDGRAHRPLVRTLSRARPARGMDAADWLTTPAAEACCSVDRGRGVRRRRRARGDSRTTRLVSGGRPSLPAGLELVADRRGRAPPRAHRAAWATKRAPGCSRGGSRTRRCASASSSNGEYAPYAKWLGTAFGRLDSTRPWPGRGAPRRARAPATRRSLRCSNAGGLQNRRAGGRAGTPRGSSSGGRTGSSMADGSPTRWSNESKAMTCDGHPAAHRRHRPGQRQHRPPRGCLAAEGVAGAVRRRAESVAGSTHGGADADFRDLRRADGCRRAAAHPALRRDAEERIPRADRVAEVMRSPAR